jgi:preprotein translocase subunit SecG
MGSLLYILDIIVASFLIIVILIQQGKGSDMGAAFGGSSQTVFGGASGRQSFLVKITVGLGTAFMLLSLGLSWRASYIQKHGRMPSPIEQENPVKAGGSAPTQNFPAQPIPGAPGQIPAMPPAQEAAPSAPEQKAPAQKAAAPGHKAQTPAKKK